MGEQLCAAAGSVLPPRALQGEESCPGLRGVYTLCRLPLGMQMYPPVGSVMLSEAARKQAE